MIDEISSNSGSTEGGQLLTITGKFFDETTSPAVVTVGGEDCTVQSVSDTDIVCLTPEKPDDFDMGDENRTVSFPGTDALSRSHF